MNIVRTLSRWLNCGRSARRSVRSSAPTFLADLTEAIAATGATIAFDCLGGGKIGGQILSCMEAAINRKATA